MQATDANTGIGWTSRFAFLMASIGFAVGLGNIWRFPYVTGENGGAAFVLVYLACAFGIGVSLPLPPKFTYRAPNPAAAATTPAIRTIFSGDFAGVLSELEVLMAVSKEGP